MTEAEWEQKINYARRAAGVYNTRMALTGHRVVHGDGRHGWYYYVDFAVVAKRRRR